jgi:hypothetical protein
MAEPHHRITINPQPVRAGNEWHVVATWPSGHPEHIKGFKTEAEAREWITGDGAKTWLRGAISMADRRASGPCKGFGLAFWVWGRAA